MLPEETLPTDTSDDDDVTVTNGSRSEQHGPPEDEILVRFQVTTSSNAMQAKQMVIEVYRIFYKHSPTILCGLITNVKN